MSKRESLYAIKSNTAPLEPTIGKKDRKLHACVLLLCCRRFVVSFDSVIFTGKNSLLYYFYFALLLLLDCNTSFYIMSYNNIQYNVNHFGFASSFFSFFSLVHIIFRRCDCFTRIHCFSYNRMHIMRPDSLMRVYLCAQNVCVSVYFPTNIDDLFGRFLLYSDPYVCIIYFVYTFFFQTMCSYGFGSVKA